MEFNQKLQELRKQKGLTQEELAEILYVSRTAVSKWEMGRGYPNIESLKAIATFFGVTVDELLSGNELLTIVEKDGKQKEKHFRDLVFGLLDISAAMLLFLPFFGQKIGDVIQAVSLLALTGIAFYLRIGYYIAVVGMMVWGVATLALQNCEKAGWMRSKSNLSLLWNVMSIILFVISLQPYAAVLLFVFFIIKILICLKRR